MSMRWAAQFSVGLALLAGPPVRAGAGSGAPISPVCGTRGAIVRDSDPITEYSAKWPVRIGALGQDYAEFGSVHPDKYHVGVDIAAPEGTPVYAMVEGIVARKWETDKSDNHCMGRVVIIDQGENFTGRGRYSLYAHLKEISDALPGSGERVKLGGEIGTVGRSGFDASSREKCRSPAGPHLHLEIKDQPILENPIGGNACNTAPCWGYTPNYPDDYGYHDPILMLHRTAPLSPAIRGGVAPHSRSRNTGKLWLVCFTGERFDPVG